LERPAISVITPSYNSFDFISDNIGSVDAQDAIGVEHIVVDGRSTDGTIEKVQRSMNSGRVQRSIIVESDNGPYDAMNKGILKARGSVIAILNSDDAYMRADVLSSVLACFQNEAVGIVYSDIVYVERGDPTSKVRHWLAEEKSTKTFAAGWHPPHPGFFVRKSIYEQFGLYNVSYKIAADFELMLRLMERYSVPSCYLNRYTVRMRLGGISGRNLGNIMRGNLECLRAFRENSINPHTLYLVRRLLSKALQVRSPKDS